MQKLLGHTQSFKHLRTVLRAGTAGHAYLVHGPDSIGKRMTVLAAIADAHGGVHPGINDPYAVVVEAEKESISIGQIRSVRRTVALRPPHGVRYCIVMDEADRMTDEAANALLKMLEEPPEYVTFFLVTALPGRLPETVRSRCAELRFVPPDRDTVHAYLAEQGIASKDAEALTTVAGGGIGWLSRVIEEKRIEAVCRDGEALQAYLGGGITERIVLAKKLAADEGLRERVLLWMHAYRANILDESDAALGHGLLALYTHLGRSSYNTRLAVEDFLLTKERTA
jgi:DNA polymerase-3 subunit delta'